MFSRSFRSFVCGDRTLELQVGLFVMLTPALGGLMGHWVLLRDVIDLILYLSYVKSNEGVRL